MSRRHDSNRRKRKEWSRKDSLVRSLLTQIDYGNLTDSRRAEEDLSEILITGEEPLGARDNAMLTADLPPGLVRRLPAPAGYRAVAPDGLTIVHYPDGVVDTYVPSGHPLRELRPELF